MAHLSEIGKSKPKMRDLGQRPSLQSMEGGSSERLSSRSRRAKSDAVRRAMEVRAELESAIHVLDNGVDRTPLPLQKAPANIPRGRRDDRGSITALMQGDSSSLFQSSIIESSPMQFGFVSTSHISPSNSSQVVLEQSSSSFASAGGDRRASASLSSPFSGSQGYLVSVGSAQFPRDVTEDLPQRAFSREERRAWLEAKTTVIITETPTIMLYTHQDEIVSNEKKEELDKVVERNNVYASLVDAKRVDEGTRFQQKGVWTFSAPKKSIHCSIQPLHKKNSGALQVTTWMLNDEFAALNAADTEVEEKQSDEEEEEEEGGELVDNVSDNGKDNSSEGTGGTLSSRGASRSAVSWMYSSTLLSSLRVMERAVVQNTMEELQLSYRGIKMDPNVSRVPRVEEETKPINTSEIITSSVTPTETVPVVSGEEGNNAGATPTIVRGKEVPQLRLSEDIISLWTFRSPLTRCRSVTCMTWNCKETDILAVGYSVPRRNEIPDHGDPLGGIVCCWSLKNPLAPERVISLPAETGVSSVAFSFEHPSLLAVGDTEGGIAIYGMQKDTNVPAIKTVGTSGQHTGAVWDLKWVARGKERGEFLMSISGDGRVVQWSVGKTIERIAPDLMTLKRQHGAVVESAFARSANMAVLNSLGGAGADKRTQKQQKQQKQQNQEVSVMHRKTDTLFSRQCGGMCMDVSPADGTIYIVGTEDGFIHQCNKSQTENYELDYAPHSELVYRVRWSPFSDWYFLTCSADWSSRLYRLGQAQQLITFDSPNQDAVQDVAWSYTNSTTFATVTAQGSAEFWSITDSIHPRSRAQFLDNRRLSSILFAEQEAAVVIIGDEKGDVTVFRLLAPCYGTQNMMADEQEQALEEAVRKATS